mgnify:CR=1 FL=1
MEVEYTGIATCQNSECLHKEKCRRFLEYKLDNSKLINFARLCNEKNSYFWKLLIETDVAVSKDENTNKSTTN